MTPLRACRTCLSSRPVCAAAGAAPVSGPASVRWLSSSSILPSGTSSTNPPSVSSPFQPRRQPFSSLTSLSATASASSAIPPSSQRAPPTTTSTRTGDNETAASSPIMASPTYRLARALKRRAPGVVDTYVAYSATADMAKLCWMHADYHIGPDTIEDGAIPKTADGEDLGVGEGWWFSEAGMQPTFSTWSQVSMLHMYMIVLRLRLFSTASSTKTWHQHLLDHFFSEAERRMEVLHGLTMRTVQQRYLKDIYTQWRGVLAAYDEGFIKGDPVLAAAVWRNVFKARQDVDPVVLAQIVAYMRRGIAMLDGLDNDTFVMGNWTFGDIADERGGVLAKSRLLN